jgi:hypothetical protein
VARLAGEPLRSHRQLREFQTTTTIQRYVILERKSICAVVFTRVQSPNPLHAILVERHIRRDDQHGLHQALGDQHPVEGIAMIQWRTRALQSVFNADRQLLEPMRFDDLHEGIGQPSEFRLFAGAPLRHDLPGARSADERLVGVFDGVPGFIRNVSTSIPPIVRARVQEQAYHSA